MLDSTGEKQSHGAVQVAVGAFDRLHVPIGNADYGKSSPFGEISL